MFLGIYLLLPLLFPAGGFCKLNVFWVPKAGVPAATPVLRPPRLTLAVLPKPRPVDVLAACPNVEPPKLDPRAVCPPREVPNPELVPSPPVEEPKEPNPVALWVPNAPTPKAPRPLPNPVDAPRVPAGFWVVAPRPKLRNPAPWVAGKMTKMSQSRGQSPNIFILDCNMIAQQECSVFFKGLLLLAILDVNPFAPKSDQFQISPAASPEILPHTVWRTWPFIAPL